MHRSAMLLLFALLGVSLADYTPDWPSLDSRPVPSWYEDAKFGIFIHWGVYSVPSYGSEHFWELWKAKKKPEYVDFMKKNYPPNFEYQDFAPMFKAELWDPAKWAALFKHSGAKFVGMLPSVLQNRILFYKGTLHSPANITRVIPTGRQSIHGTGTAWMWGRAEI